MSTLRHILILVSILTLSLSSNAQTAWKADHLKTIFSNPPQEYHPFVRWWYEESPTIGAFDSEAEKRQLAVKAKVPYKIDLH